MWQRNGAFYAQITVPDETTGKKTVLRRLRLECADGTPLATIAEASMALNSLKVQRDESALKVSPTQADARFCRIR